MPRCGGDVGDDHPNAGHSWLFYKIANGSETGNAVFVNSATRNYVMTITPVSGVNASLPFSYVRSGLFSDDGALNNLASRFANGLGMCFIAYESTGDQGAAVMSGGAAANWALAASSNATATTSTSYGVLAFVDTADFATITAGAGATTWNTIAQSDYRMVGIVLNSDAAMSAAPVYDANTLYKSGIHSAGSAVTTVPGFSTESGGISISRTMMLPGAVIVGAILGNVETAAITGWKTANSAKAFTQVTGSPYDHTGASPALSLWVGVMVLGEEDCYHTTLDDFTATIDSSIVAGLVQSWYVASASAYLYVKEGTFETIDANSTAPDPAAIVTDRANSLVVCIDGSNTATASTASTGYTKGAEVLNTSSTFRATMQSKLVAAAGSEDPGAWTTANTEHVMYSLALSMQGQVAGGGGLLLVGVG